MKAIRVLVVAVMAAGLMAVLADSASATTITVHQGDSIQAAIDSAHKGDIISIGKGTYTENLVIREKSGLRLLGHNSVLVPPGSPKKNICVDDTGFPGICVVGQVDKDFNVTKTLDNVQIDGMTIDGFSHEGIFAYGTNGITVSHNILKNNGGYGVFSLNSGLVTYTDNNAHGNEEAGFYVGESPNAHVTIQRNTAADNGNGIFFRDSRGGVISDNTVHDNCIGILALDTGAGAKDGDVVIRNNTVNHNNRFCPAGDGPANGGIGIGLGGADHVTVRDNTITNNHQQPSTDIPGGGVVLVDTSGSGGRTPKNNGIKNNTLSNNTPNDIFDDGSGSGNTYSGNSCTTSNIPVC